MSTATRDTNHAKRQAESQLESIREMVRQLAGDSIMQGNAETQIAEHPLSVLVREPFHRPGEKVDSEEFEILLMTGGPACRIVGDLGQGNEPEKPRIEYQDWGTPWTELRITAEQEADLLTYCQQFYYGE